MRQLHRFNHSLRVAWRRVESGQVVLLVAGSLVVLMLFAGLATDISRAWGTRLQMQAAADAGALAGVDATFAGGSGDSTTAAKDATSQNGFTQGLTTPNDSHPVSITVNTPPQSGNYKNRAQTVEVIVQQAQPTTFLGLLGIASFSVSARGVATVQSSTSCVYTTNPTASGSLLLNSNVQLNSPCGVMVNSSSSSAVILNSNSSIKASAVGIVGGQSINSNGSISPTPVTGIAAAADPLASLPTPSVTGSCTNLSPVNGNQTATENPGYYCGLTANSNSTVTLNPGFYSFKGNVTINSNSKLSGTGITLYFKTGALTANSNATLNLTAPTSGIYAGIVVYSDRANTAGMTINSNSSSTLTGALYIPDGTLTMNSNGFANVYSILVANNITMNSNANLRLNNDYSSLANGSPIQRSAMVE